MRLLLAVYSLHHYSQWQCLIEIIVSDMNSGSAFFLLNKGKYAPQNSGWVGFVGLGGLHNFA